MGTYFHTYLRLEAETDPGAAADRILSLLGASPTQHRFLRVQHRCGFPWVRVEHLGFYSLKKQAAVEAVSAVVSLFPREAVMVCAQTTAGCAAYAHYVAGSLSRFLSAGEQWFEIYGQPEPWEAKSLSWAGPPSYAVGEDSPFYDGTIPDIGAHYGLPGFEAAAISDPGYWEMDRGLGV